MQGVINVCYRPRVRLCGEERARLGRATATAEESRPPTSGSVPPQSVQPLQGAGSLNLAVSYPLPALKISTIQKTCQAQISKALENSIGFGMGGAGAVLIGPSTSPNLDFNAH